VTPYHESEGLPRSLTTLPPSPTVATGSIDVLTVAHGGCPVVGHQVADLDRQT
jgi:hypothetical protein